MPNIQCLRKEIYDNDQLIATQYHLEKLDLYEDITFLFGELLSYYIGGVKPIHIERCGYNNYIAKFKTVNLRDGACDCYADILDMNDQYIAFTEGETLFSNNVRLIRRITKRFDVNCLYIIKEENYERIVRRIKELGITYQLNAIKS